MTTTYPFQTVCFKTVGDISLYLDIYPPDDNTSSSIPAVLYFHGGGLAVGNRQSWFPKWLQKRVCASNFAFVTADYRLMPPGTGHAILEDVKDALSYLAGGHTYTFDAKHVNCTSNGDGGRSGRSFKINSEAIAVAGSSAGGLCTYLAGAHCKSPAPKALVSLYGMGGDYLSPHYLQPKTKIFFRGRELLDPIDFGNLVYPFPGGLPAPIADSPLSYHPASSPTPGYPANRRMQVTRLYLQLGTCLDYYTGLYEPSLSQTLRDAAHPFPLDAGKLRHVIPQEHVKLFPQFCVDASWPPIYLCHGSEDSAVPVHDSRNMHELLQAAGVNAELHVVEGVEHSFDYEPTADVVHGALFDEIMAFLCKTLLS